MTVSKDTLIGRLEALLAKATPGPWDVWRERTATREDAVAELAAQVAATELFTGGLFMLNAGGRCPALTGCGPTSEANADLIVEAVNALPALLSALRTSAKEVEAAWRDGWAECKAILTDDEAFCLTHDVEQDAWMDSTTRAALTPSNPKDAS